MLNVTAFRLLSDPERVTTTALRLFLRLCCDYDLTQYRAIVASQLVQSYDLSYPAIFEALSLLVSVGILEEGPVMRRPRSTSLVSTYRVRAAFLLSKEDRKEHYRELRERQERETMIPVSSIASAARPSS